MVTEAAVSTVRGVTVAYSGENLESGTLYRVEVQGIRNISRFEKNTETKLDFFRTSNCFIYINLLFFFILVSDLYTNKNLIVKLYFRKTLFNLNYRTRKSDEHECG